MVRQMLKSFKVNSAKPLPPRHSPFTFETTGFYATLRDKIWAEHGGKVRTGGKSRVAAIGPSWQSNIMAGAVLVTITLSDIEHGILLYSQLKPLFTDCVVLVSMLLTVAAGSAKSMFASTVAAVTAGIVNGSFIGIGHNFLHQKDNFRRYYQDISGFSSVDICAAHAHAACRTFFDALL